MASSIDLDETLTKLGIESADLAATMPDARATIEPARRADTAGQRALAVLAELSGMRTTKSGSLTIERTLGQGGMGVVHLGTQVALGRKVAVKTLRPEHRNEATAMQLLREAWVIGALEHPNVVPVYDLGLDAEGHPYIVLKRIEGEAWSVLMHDAEKIRQRFGADDALDWNLQILIQVCNALSFAHSRGILHRDLKPDNVMIGEFGEVYVVDWGIAVSLRDDGSGRLPLANDGNVELCGTPAYLAPEMVGGASAKLSERTDVYLLGGILYEIATGHAPHEGETLKAVLMKVLASNPHFPDSIEPELARICRRALAADPDARFENAQQLRLALQGFLHRRGSAQLVAQADARLQKLRAELSAPDGGAPAIARRQALYHLFGECRFGFQQALRTWHDNQAAHDGLAAATTAMIEYELAQGDPKAAALLASELDAAPPTLRARIDEAVRLFEAERERARALEKIGSDYDFSVGRRTRVFLTIVLGALWTALPLTVPMRSFYDTYWGMVAMSGGLLVLMVVLAIWARESMMKTAINRALVGSVLFTVTAQMVLHTGSWLMHMPVHMSQMLDPFIWFCVSSLISISVDRRLAPAAVGYLATFLFACAVPEWAFVAMSASNLLLTMTAVGVWRDGERPRALHDRKRERGRERSK